MTVANRPVPKKSSGLRERKKAATRRLVADVAARMFAKHGYENVRMVDIAQAADVSEQTLYNYFPTKEHLIFDRDREFEEFVLGVVLQRRPGHTLAESLRAGARQFLDQISPAIGKPSWVPASVATSPELHRVWLEINARCAAGLTDALIKTEGGRAPRPALKVMARAIVALFAVLVEGVGEGNLRGESRAAIVQELQASIEACAQFIQRGFPIDRTPRRSRVR